MKTKCVRVFGILLVMAVGTLIAESRIFSQTHVAYYVDSETGQQVEYTVPFRIVNYRWSYSESGTDFWVDIKGSLNSTELAHSVFSLEVSSGDLVIAYSNNFVFPGLDEPSSVGVIRYDGATLVARGNIEFGSDYIHIFVPLRIETPRIALLRYLPSEQDVVRASGGLFSAITSYVWGKRNVYGALPSWPAPYGLQQRWQRGQQMSVPTSPSDRPTLRRDRVIGQGNGIWPRDISLTDDPWLGVGDKSIGWGLEQGGFPYGGFDRSDAWVGLVGEDSNRDGRIDPGEVTGVIGRCEPAFGDNNFYVDKDGIVHYENYNPDGSIRKHYIYDPNRDILKIYVPGKREHIYMGPPTRWR